MAPWPVRPGPNDHHPPPRHISSQPPSFEVTLLGVLLLQALRCKLYQWSKNNGEEFWVEVRAGADLVNFAPLNTTLPSYSLRELANSRSFGRIMVG